ncbi:MAG: hypothetical protein AAF721_15740 [Myxococcota bacterium]
MTVQLPVLLTVRGTIAQPNLDAVRKIHNETAGSPEGIANARGLGDLSHKVYEPIVGPQSQAKAGEALFMDTWLDADGIMKFFGDERVAKTSTMLFEAREPAIWVAAEGAFHYAQPAPMGKDGGYVGLVRGEVTDAAKAIATFASGAVGSLSAARRRGLVSHSVYVKLAAPGDSAPTEVLGFERWFDRDGMAEHYTDDEAMRPLGGVFAGRPDATMWKQADGHWSEW